MAGIVEGWSQGGNGGYFAEWYREDQHGRGEIARWYGSRIECDVLAKQENPPAECEWFPLSEVGDGNSDYQAGYAYACGYYD